MPNVRRGRVGHMIKPILPQIAINGAASVLINGQKWTVDDLRLLVYDHDRLWEEREPLMQRESRLCLMAAEIIEAVDHRDESTYERVITSVEKFKAWLAREEKQT